MVEKYGKGWDEKTIRHCLRSAETFSILCAEGNKEQIELLQLDKAVIKVAEYLIELPGKKLLQQKLHQAIEISKKQMENNEQADKKQSF